MHDTDVAGSRCHDNVPSTPGRHAMRARDLATGVFTDNALRIAQADL
jgi:hypothetical protein